MSMKRARFAERTREAIAPACARCAMFDTHGPAGSRTAHRVPLRGYGPAYAAGRADLPVVVGGAG